MSSAGQQLVAGRIPGERIATTVATSDSSDFTTTEVALMSVTAPLVDGRTYAIRAHFALSTDTDDNEIDVRIREDTVSGTVIQSAHPHFRVSGTFGEPLTLYTEYTASATGNKTFVLTGDLSSGSGNSRMEAAASRPSYLYVDYISG